MTSLQEKFLKFYDFFIRIVYNITIIILMFVLLIILGRIVLELGALFFEESVRLGIKDLVTNVLSLIVILELVRAFVEYFEHHRLRMEILVEMLIAFCIREFMILIFQGKLSGIEVFYWTLGIFLLLLGRSLAIVIRPGGFKLFKKAKYKRTKEKD